MSGPIDEWSNDIHQGDALELLPELPEESVHAVVTDPPYALGDDGFMSRDWDNFDGSASYQEWCEAWGERCRRVLKPGGHLLAFGGNTRHHRLFSGIEDAGFIVRDTLTYHYGTGYPKALDVSKAIDDQAGAEREVVGTYESPENTTGFESENDGKLYAEKHSVRDITAPATDAAEKWAGWKTTLKPATEFVVVARKPLSEDTVAENVRAHGTGALNVDACRLAPGSDVDRSGESTAAQRYSERGGTDIAAKPGPRGGDDTGRYPANVVFDEAAAERLDRDVGELPKGGGSGRGESGDGWGMDSEDIDDLNFPDSGGPSRFFYTSKASRRERCEGGSVPNDHPCVKPLDLMEWLVTLVTREGQIVCDPFAGSGTTCKAAKQLGRRFIGIEQQAKYVSIAQARAGVDVDDPDVLLEDGETSLAAYADGGSDA